MALSEHEQRKLDQIERHLTNEGLDLTAQLKTVISPRIAWSLVANLVVVVGTLAGVDIFLLLCLPLTLWIFGPIPVWGSKHIGRSQKYKLAAQILGVVGLAIVAAAVITLAAAFIIYTAQAVTYGWSIYR